MNPDIVCKDIEDERVLYNPATGEVRVVNETGRFILDQCMGKLSGSQIIEKVIGCYSGVPADKIKKDVIDFLSELMKREILHKAAP